MWSDYQGLLQLPSLFDFVRQKKIKLQKHSTAILIRACGYSIYSISKAIEYRQDLKFLGERAKEEPPMEKFAEVQIFPKVSKSFEDIRTALGIFRRLLNEGFCHAIQIIFLS